MNQKYRLNVPKILESIMNSPKIHESTSSLVFFSKYQESAAHEVSNSFDHQLDSEFQSLYKLKQSKIIIQNSIQQLRHELKFITKLEQFYVKTEQNVAILKQNQNVLVQLFE
ncbi:Hypothetical_protein [Hexamita inflata]|uniref:Hypothetical_protein n=1 Tax=Hexamita inflata TaxID=28002 RepID=A0ABP1KZY2_9EUKA